MVGLSASETDEPGLWSKDWCLDVKQLTIRENRCASSRMTSTNMTLGEEMIHLRDELY